MSKEKFTLKDLEVTSFVTTLDGQALNEVKGGYIIQGRRYRYRSRWTSVDTRVEMQDSSNQSGNIRSH